MSRRATFSPGPLDQALERLRVHRIPYRWSYSDLRVFEAGCPACAAGGWDLIIREAFHGAPITLRCTAGRCTDEEIRAALACEPVEPRVEAALQLAERATEIAHRVLELKAAA